MNTRKGHVTLDAPLDHIPVHVRGGHIIPTQEPANNTAFRYLICVLQVGTQIEIYDVIILKEPRQGLHISKTLA